MRQCVLVIKLQMSSLKNLQSAAVVLLGLLCYHDTINGDFVFDDNEAILNNQDILLETDYTKLWYHDFWGSNIKSNLSHKSYRPLVVFSFRYSSCSFYIKSFIVFNLSDLVSSD